MSALLRVVIVDDEALAEAMKERGLGTPATRADTIDGLINQKYIDRPQRELIPTAKAEQLLQFLGAVKAERLWPGLAWVVVPALGLNVVGLWWGLPATWVAIETLPVYVLDGLGRWFSHGWYDAYPPLHYYLLALVSAGALSCRPQTSRMKVVALAISGSSSSMLRSFMGASVLNAVLMAC